MSIDSQTTFQNERSPLGMSSHTSLVDARTSVRPYSKRLVNGRGEQSKELLLRMRAMVWNSAHRMQVQLREIAEASGIIGQDANRNEVIVGGRAREDVAVPLLDLLALNDKLPSHTAVLGLAEDGTIVRHHFGARDTSHLLLAGDRDAGKTAMLRTIAISLAIHNRQSEIQLAVVSPIAADMSAQRRQAAAWLPLNYLPHMVCDAAFRHAEVNDLLAFLSREVDHRLEKGFSTPAIVLLVDQADLVLERGGQGATRALHTVAQRGEQAGIFLAISTSKLTRRLFGPRLLADVPLRLIGHQHAEGKSASPRFHSLDSENLLGQGDFYILENGNHRRLQAAYMDDYDLRAQLNELYRYNAILLAQPRSKRLSLAGAERVGEINQQLSPPLSPAAETESKSARYSRIDLSELHQSESAG